MTRAMFRVEKCIEIPVHGRSSVDLEAVDAIRQNPPAALARYGCYIFAAYNGRRRKWLPVYVGMAKRQTLAKESLSSDKMMKVSAYLQANPTSENVRLFAIVAPRKNLKAIQELEDWLIPLAHSANPELQNDHGTHALDWGIQGVVRSGRGSRSDQAGDLKKLLGLDSECD